MRIIECNYVTPYDVQDQYRPLSGIQPPPFNWYDNNAYEADRTNTQVCCFLLLFLNKCANHIFLTNCSHSLHLRINLLEFMYPVCGQMQTVSFFFSLNQ